MSHKVSKATARAKRAAQQLRIYVRGPGVGESIIIQFPNGRWAVVDCHQTKEKTQIGTIDFLKSRNVDALEFFCMTHPHEDHFKGAHQLISEFTGKIREIWQPPPMTSKDFEGRIALDRRIVFSAKLKHRIDGDPEARDCAEEYVKFLSAISRETRMMAPDKHRFVSGTILLYQDSKLKITSMGPHPADLEHALSSLTKTDFKSGLLLLNDDEGEVLNGVSVILHIQYGRSDVLLLADSQGEKTELHSKVRRVSLLKVAHHGSNNGRSATRIVAVPLSYKIENAVVTPYSRSSLPREDMVLKYRASCHELHVTATSQHANLAHTPVPRTPNTSRKSSDSGWKAFSVGSSGSVKEIPSSN
jgi:beta-lactamase superfamily II metal-dependent hydrolase